MIEKQPNVSFADFVACEHDQSELHELIGGGPSGSSPVPSITKRSRSMSSRSCTPRSSRPAASSRAIRTISRTAEDGYRPDITVSCSKANVGQRLYVEPPRIVVEVVSPSNSGREWNAKLFEYWNTPSIEQLVLIESLERFATSYVRDAGGTWQAPVFVTGGSLSFTPIGVRMRLDDVYRNASLE